MGERIAEVEMFDRGRELAEKVDEGGGFETGGTVAAEVEGVELMALFQEAEGRKGGEAHGQEGEFGKGCALCEGSEMFGEEPELSECGGESGVADVQERAGELAVLETKEHGREKRKTV